MHNPRTLPKNDKSRTWEENQRPIITVTTVEDFWSLYNHIETPSKLPPGSDYSLFKARFLNSFISCKELPECSLLDHGALHRGIYRYDQ